MHLLKCDHFNVQFALVQNVPAETHVITFFPIVPSISLLIRHSLHVAPPWDSERS